MGHFSENWLYELINRRWWWENLYKDAINFCRNCPECAVVSGTGKLQKPLLHPISISRPSQIMRVDIMEFPVTEKGNRYETVFQDFLSKFSIRRPSESCNCLQRISYQLLAAQRHSY